MDKLTVLREYFGYPAFRPGQEKFIEAILDGGDAFGIMPTGGGKSLCYQVPAMLLSGVTLVVSPLISLMHDQVLALKKTGVPAAYINSTLSLEQMRAVFANIRAGKYKLIYMAPERLETEGFQRLAGDLDVALLAVDEAHCISQWGQDFRPSYLRIPAFIRSLRRRPVVAAFTATATETVREDVVRLLELHDPLIEITGFDRPNLRFAVFSGGKKDGELLRLLGERKDRSGIIYCATRKRVETVCETLCAQGISATRYHAGLPEEERRRNQEDFVYDRKPVMVATNAFGMGIDKSNVRFVIHYNMPQSLEAYYQEAGRAGRDGEPADCILQYSAGDVSTARYLIEHGEENQALSPEARSQVLAMDLQRLETMVGYCKTRSCLRGYILDYFGQSHPETCGNCSNCEAAYETVDITREAQMILSCVKRIQTKLGYCVGPTLVVRTLRGSREKRVQELGLNSLSTFGLMGELPRDRVNGYIQALEEAGYLYMEPTYRTLRLTGKADPVLYDQQPVLVQLKRENAQKQTRNTPPKASSLQPDAGVFEALRALRREIANREGLPAYVVFSDATLRDMAAKLPRNERELLEVSGVGEYKLKKYGKAFLEKLSRFT